ncbi:MAG TPA: hypothetical protein VGX25_16085 [Actinophytocola sp.]|uniref:hypothetical protein n=1 Tax=Actinophytocola sp. TaxID=1872138 RepID=UPI002DDD0459|nr:hypothetical protein [Actinophytocola sp.]HEV2780905.1 hypothetical protein [Actinophytocola sp.]
MVNESEVKDTIQVATDVTVDHLGRIASIIAGAVRDIAQELGSWANDILEARDTAQRSRADETVVDPE